jgi:hypothetical protein
LIEAADADGANATAIAAAQPATTDVIVILMVLILFPFMTAGRRHRAPKAEAICEFVYRATGCAPRSIATRLN